MGDLSGLVVRILGAGCLAMMVPALHASAGTRRHRGAAMFFGREPLRARIREHEGFLPPEVVRCANCHGEGSWNDPEAGDGTTSGEAASAPGPSTRRIDRYTLMEQRSRRGGPPSAYDSESFCRLLRTGVDPAYVVVAREMPVYEIDHPRCLDLWRYVTGEEAGEKQKENEQKNEREKNGDHVESR
jgi:hypothetical protein